MNDNNVQTDTVNVQQPNASEKSYYMLVYHTNYTLQAGESGEETAGSKDFWGFHGHSIPTRKLSDFFW